LDNQDKGNPKKMKKNRYSPEQIIYALKQGEGGEKAVEICRKMGVSEATYDNWKRSMEVRE
jgi:putative transposase